MKKILITISLITMSMFTISAHVKQRALPEELFGVHTGLIQKIHCPIPRGAQRRLFPLLGFKVLGYSKGRTFCGTKGKAGYYVYLAPYWYVYRNRNKHTPLTVGSVNGKYLGLKKKIRCPQMSSYYKTFTEYGYYPHYANTCGRSGSGFHVYYRPYLYVWEKIRDDYPIPEDIKQIEDYRFSNLLFVFPCHKDEKDYGKVYHYGLYGDPSGKRYCGYHTLKGYWVYMAPNWYIFKDREKGDFSRDDNAWPKR